MTQVRTRSGLAALLVTAALLIGCARSPEARRDRFVTRGKDFIEKRDYSRAILEFKNAIQVMPKDAELYYQTGMAAALSGDTRTAIFSFRRTLELNPSTRRLS